MTEKKARRNVNKIRYDEGDLTLIEEMKKVIKDALYNFTPINVKI